MKSIFSNKNFWTIGLLMSLFLGTFGLTSCEEEYYGNTPIRVSKVYLQDAKTTIKEREVTFARLGSVIRIEGEGFLGLKKVYINGYNTYFNPVMLSDKVFFIQIAAKTPILEADESVRNTIRFVKDEVDFTYNFTVRDAAPTLTSISNTLPAAGDTITIYGKGLTEISKITFPGGVEVTEGIVSEETGKYCKVKVPAGLTESGSILIEGSNGGVYSPAYFNCKSGVILDFDGVGSQGFWGWSETGSMINASDLESAVIGLESKSQGKYCAHRPTRLASFAAAKNRNTEVWTAGNDVDNWRGRFTTLVPAITPVSEFAFQFDIYVPETWTGTGFLKINLINNFNGGEWTGKCYNYVPWLKNGAITPFITTGWTTVTIPFSKFYQYAGTDAVYTFENVLADREAASWQNFGIFFENSDIKLSNITGSANDENTILPSSATSVKVYTDNWRIVPLTKPDYSDFPETAN